MARNQRLSLLPLIALTAFIIMPFTVFCWAPAEASMSDYFRIFFMHLPLAWWGLFSLFSVFACSIVFLAKPSASLDRWAQAATETGVLFSALALATGMVWAKISWGVWWRWEPKLFTTLLLCLMYLGCILLRHSSSRAKSKNICAALAIAAFVNVPFIFLSSRWLQGAHPPPLVLQGDISAGMLPALGVCLVCAGTIWLALTRLRFAQISMQEKTAIITHLNNSKQKRSTGNE